MQESLWFAVGYFSDADLCFGVRTGSSFVGLLAPPCILLLVPVDSGARRFVRIGVGTVKVSLGLFDGLDRCEIVLV